MTLDPNGTEESLPAHVPADPSDVPASPIPQSLAPASPDAAPADESVDSAQGLEPSTPEPLEGPRESVALDEADLPLVVEALLFAATSPLSIDRIGDVLDKRFDARAIRRAMEELNRRCDDEHRAFAVEEIAGGFQLFTRPDFYPWVARLLKKRVDVRLSSAALDTLAIIAYKQPITRAAIEDLRGVAVAPILRNLLDMSLIRIVGRSSELGRPMLYGTTRFFLQHFGLKSLKDLPDVRELERPGA
ncbi:MAG: SMC-Scp complex subunit ScpB [Planctomycetota bacterium]